MITTSRPQSDPALLKRLDPGYWDPAYRHLLAGCDWELVPLGDYIEHITYGPIVTGRKPPATRDEGVAIINQGQLLFSGVDITGAIVVPPDCDWDVPRARIQANDLLIARSGSGSVGKNRLCVFCDDLGNDAWRRLPACENAAVGSFVDLVRLRELDPFYVAAFLKTRFGWGQIFRIINGVGTPNISFSEIGELLVPRLPAGAQWRVRHRYHLQVLPPHRTAINYKLQALRRGIPAKNVDEEPEVALGLEEASTAYRALLDDLEAYLTGQRGEI